jgi:hypothetical protein
MQDLDATSELMLCIAAVTEQYEDLLKSLDAGDAKVLQSRLQPMFETMNKEMKALEEAVATKG